MAILEMNENIKRIRAMSDEEALFWYLKGRKHYDNIMRIPIEDLEEDIKTLNFIFDKEFSELFSRARESFRTLDMDIINYQICITNLEEDFTSYK